MSVITGAGKIIKWEPHGGSGGQEFDDYHQFKSAPAIHQLQVNVGETLDHLVVSYSFAGDFYPIQHGESNFGTPHPPFILDRPEVLTKVEAWFHTFDGTRELGGLRFTVTDFNVGRTRTSDLYASRDVRGRPADYVFDATKVIGGPGVIIAFCGRQGLFVNALGVYVQV